MKISSAFDSGNIEVVNAEDAANVRLRIRQDTKAEFFQWFHFRAAGVRGTDCRFVIENAGGGLVSQGVGGVPRLRVL